MDRGSTVYLACRLTRSGFSSERVFRVPQADGEECVGAAPVHYCWNEAGRRLGDDEPRRGDSMAGIVAGHVLANGGETAKVELPDGQWVEVQPGQLLSLTVERYPHVPVRS